MSVSQREQGMSLVEVLIGIVIAGFALLGTARLQALALNHAFMTSAHTAAAMQTSNLIAMMKSNPAYWQAVSDPFDVIVDINNATRITGDAALNAVTKDCFTATNCDQQDMAAQNLILWGQSIDAGLPASRGQVTRIGSAIPPRFRITISWSEKLMSLGNNATRYGAGNTAANYQIVVQP
ncbi:MAG TPA: hypothetical protein ENJ84_04380 [Gammaproteobacteria bacterium]|nr:hypothetical protein [Gammaproteobacteria bacterium]